MATVSLPTMAGWSATLTTAATWTSGSRSQAFSDLATTIGASTVNPADATVASWANLLQGLASYFTGPRYATLAAVFIAMETAVGAFTDSVATVMNALVTVGIPTTQAFTIATQIVAFAGAGGGSSGLTKELILATDIGPADFDAPTLEQLAGVQAALNDAIASLLPDQTGHGGAILSSDGTNLVWVTPTQVDTGGGGGGGGGGDIIPLVITQQSDGSALVTGITGVPQSDGSVLVADRTIVPQSDGSALVT